MKGAGQFFTRLIVKQFFNMRIRVIIIFVLAIATLSACGLIRVVDADKNPKKPGRIPNFSQEEILLGEYGKYRKNFDVNYYDLLVEILPETKTLSGLVEIHGRATLDVDTIQIDLHTNHTIHEILDKTTGTHLNFSRLERAVYVEMPKKKDEKFILEVAYSGKPPVAAQPPWKGGFVWRKDHNGKPWVGVACESEGASIWWPLKDHTRDEPDSIKMRYRVPKGLTAVGNGKLLEINSLGAVDEYVWYVSYPINTYNVTVYVGEFSKITSHYPGLCSNLDVSHYVFGKNVAKAEKHFEQVNTILAVFEELYGAFPFCNDGYKLVESPYDGMEHQTAIAYGNGFNNDLFGKVDYIILHETAHEWWGNSVTAGDFADIWLQEGFATYSEALFLEKVYGNDLANRLMDNYKYLIANKYALVSVEDRRWFHYRAHADAYFKGAWVLHTLRKQLNNDVLFFKILKTFAINNKYQIVRTKDFIEQVNSESGSDYSWFFEMYLEHNEVPVMEYAIDQKGFLYYQWANVPENFNKLKVGLNYYGTELTVIPDNTIQSIKIPGHKHEIKSKLKTNMLCYIKLNEKLQGLSSGRN